MKNDRTFRGTRTLCAAIALPMLLSLSSKCAAQNSERSQNIRSKQKEICDIRTQSSLVKRLEDSLTRVVESPSVTSNQAVWLLKSPLKSYQREGVDFDVYLNEPRHIGRNLAHGIEIETLNLKKLGSAPVPEETRNVFRTWRNRFVEIRAKLDNRIHELARDFGDRYSIKPRPCTPKRKYQH